MGGVRLSASLRVRVGLGVAVLCLASPNVPIAAADEGPPIPVAGDAASAALDAALETVSAVAAADTAPQDIVTAAVAEVAQPLPTAVEAAPPVTAPTAAEPAPTETAPAAATPAPEAPVAAETTEMEPVPTEAAPTEAGVEPAVSGAPAAADVAPAADAVQVQPVNLNLAVRIDSPGDNGAVTQVNAATATAAEQYQPSAPQYQPPEAGGAAPAAPAPGAAVAAEETSPAPEETGWSWTWSCGGATQQLAPAGMLPANWSWNWTWSCAAPENDASNRKPENNGQYHAGVLQYQPVNLNVSIRIGSPGNDGPVRQTNVAVAVVVPPVLALPAMTGAALPLPVAIPLPAAVVPTTEQTSSAAGPQPLAAVEVDITAELAEEYDVALAAWISAGPVRPFGSRSSFVSSAGTAMMAQPPPAVAAVRSAAFAQLRIAPSASRTSVAATAHGIEARPQATARDASSAQRHSRRNDPKRPLPPRRTPVLASGLAAAAPAGGADGGWPLLALLLVPFAFALVDSTGRLAREASPPADAELRSRRDRPG